MAIWTALPVIGELLKPIFDIIDKAIPDRDAAEKAKHELAMKTLDIQAQLQLGQIETNKAEAASDGIFKGGWRPFIGWTCGVALGWYFMGYDIAQWLLAVTRATVPPIAKPAGFEYLFELVLAMLGLAGFRTFEKAKSK